MAVKIRKEDDYFLKQALKLGVIVYQQFANA